MTPYFWVFTIVRHEEIAARRTRRDRATILQVRFSSTIPAHCAEQTFYFNEKGLLQRLDYVTEIAGGVAAHYCFDHASFAGRYFRRSVAWSIPRRRARSSRVRSASWLISDVVVS
jgi:hypothetical protein